MFPFEDNRSGLGRLNFDKISLWLYWLTDPPWSFSASILPDSHSFSSTSKEKNLCGFRLNNAKYSFEVVTRLSLCVSANAVPILWTVFSFPRYHSKSKPMNGLLEIVQFLFPTGHGPYHTTEFRNSLGCINLYRAHKTFGVTVPSTTTTKFSKS